MSHVPTSTKARSATWVSKTDLIRFVRCPYAFWLLDTGKITFEDTIDEFQAGLLSRGVKFQEMIEGAATPIEIGPGELPQLLQTDVKLLGVPSFENRKLKIYGRPDGIDGDRGALIPMEVKAHKDVQVTDELELAFYWMLLEPYRSRTDVQPRGVLMLRRDGRPEIADVPIKSHRFDDVTRLLSELRHARRYGVRPRICGCIVCSQVRREDVLAAALHRKDLTLICGIGRHYAPALEAMGIATYDDLLACDANAVKGRLREHRYCVSLDEVNRWKRHAEAWSFAKPIYFGPAPCVGDSFIALDLEFDSMASTIWLVGICVVEGEERRYTMLWSDDEVEERANLRRLAKIVGSHPALPIVTWAGDSADIPQLRSAAKRLRLRVLAPVFDRHRDLYGFTRSSVRLPIPGLDLKGVAAYFGIPRTSIVRDGLGAQIAYNNYRMAKRRNDGLKLRDMLLAYARDDLDALVGAAQHIRALAIAGTRTP